MRPHARTPARTRQPAAWPDRRADVGGGAPQPPASPRAPAAGRERECHPSGGVPRTARSRSTDRCDGVRRLACANGGVGLSTARYRHVNVRAARSPGTLLLPAMRLLGITRGRPGTLPCSAICREVASRGKGARPPAPSGQLPQAGRRKTYPTPRTVWMNWGADGSPSSWLRSQWMCTSTVRVSPA